MSFAKLAADALVNDDAELERDEQRGRWKKWLATALGVGALGAGGYALYKNWDQLAPKIDGALGVKPPTWMGQNGSLVGATAGVAGGMARVGNHKLPWNPTAKSNTLTGLRDLSASPNDTAAGKAVAGLDERAGLSRALANQIEAGTRQPAAAATPPAAVADGTLPPPPASPAGSLLVAARNYGAGGKPVSRLAGGDSLWDRVRSYVHSTDDLTHVIGGLEKTERDPTHPVSQTLENLSQHHFKMPAGELAGRLRHVRTLPNSKMAPLWRGLAHGAVGGVLGAGAGELSDWIGNR